MNINNGVEAKEKGKEGRSSFGRLNLQLPLPSWRIPAKGLQAIACRVVTASISES